MGAIIALMATGMIAAWLYWMVTKRDTRSKFFEELRDEPLGMTIAVAMTICGLAFIWGVMVPPVGEVPIHLGSLKLQLWSAGGIAFAVLLVLLLMMKPKEDRRS